MEVDLAGIRGSAQRAHFKSELGQDRLFGIARGQIKRNQPDPVI
jgi:hypothetical protein